VYALILGQLEEVGPPTILVANGIGYELWLPERSILRLPPVGEEVRFYTHLRVREDELTLYGFESGPEREVFRALISVNGVGPRVALSVLGSPQAEEVLGAVARGDSRPLLAVKGIGKKTAERIVLELEDKATAWAMAGTRARGAATVVESGPDHEAALVLESLGMSIDRARAAVLAAREASASLPSDVEGLVRAALRQVSPPS
jgi:holliday junction DNA helicase RuvA